MQKLSILNEQLEETELEPTGPVSSVNCLKKNKKTELKIQLMSLSTNEQAGYHYLKITSDKFKVIIETVYKQQVKMLLEFLANAMKHKQYKFSELEFDFTDCRDADGSNKNTMKAIFNEDKTTLIFQSAYNKDDLEITLNDEQLSVIYNIIKKQLDSIILK